MTALQTRRLTLALVAQVMVCLSAAPVVAAKLAIAPKTHQSDPAPNHPEPNHDAAFQAARDAANVRPEEVNDRRNDCGSVPIAGKTLRARHPQKTDGAGTKPNVPDDGALAFCWSARFGHAPLTQSVAGHEPPSLSTFEIGTFLQPTGPPLRG